MSVQCSADGCTSEVTAEMVESEDHEAMTAHVSRGYDAATASCKGGWVVLCSYACAKKVLGWSPEETV